MQNLLFLIPDYIDKSHNYLQIFGFKIYYYALAITFGMLLCVLAAIPLFKKRGEQPDFLLDLMIGVIPCSIIMARLVYVLFDINSFHSFLEVIDIRSGGLAIYGGVAGGALGIFIVCKIHKKPVLKFFDFGAVMLPLGQAIGRWGNYFNQEVYGAVDPKGIGLPVSVYIQSTGNYHYALFLWESLANLVLFALLYWFLYRYQGKRNGYATGLYFIGYGVIRAIMEPMRDAQFNLPLFGIEALKGMEWVAIIMIIAGTAILLVNYFRDLKDHGWAMNGKDMRAYFDYMFEKPKKKKKNAEEVQEEESTSVPVKKISAKKDENKEETKDEK